MARGRDIQRRRQMGEHLVVAELGRRGWLATPFAGSVPGFDIVAESDSGHLIDIQVKAMASGTWQLNADQYLRIDLVDGVQKVRGLIKPPRRERYCVFVRLREAGTDEFYVFTWRTLQGIVRRDYKAGRRPKRADTKHHALAVGAIAQYRNRWETLKPASRGGPK